MTPPPMMTTFLRACDMRRTPRMIGQEELLRDSMRIRACIIKCLSVALAVASSAAPGVVRAQCAPDVPYQQSDAAKSRYPDPHVKFDTPAFAAGKTGFTTHEELLAFMQRLERGSRNVQI